MGAGLLDMGHEVTAGRRLAVLLIGPTAPVRVALRQMLGAAAEVTITGDVRPEQEALDIARRTPPNITLIDAPDLDQALTFVRRLQAASPDTRPIILSDEEFGDSFLKAMVAGVWGILSRDLSQGELIRAMRQVARGRAVIACALQPVQLAQLRKLRAWRADPGVVLTDREATVIRAVAAGRTDTQIAQQLGVAVPTVKSHMRAILRKTRASNRAAAIAAAFRSGALP